MPAVKRKIAIDQGATLRKPFTWKPGGVTANLTGYTARMQIRETLESDTVIHELTTENGGILLNEEAGQFTLYISDQDTSAFDFETAVYDLEMVAPDGDVTRLLYGSVTLSREVTR